MRARIYRRTSRKTRFVGYTDCPNCNGNSDHCDWCHDGTVTIDEAEAIRGALDDRARSAF